MPFSDSDLRSILREQLRKAQLERTAESATLAADTIPAGNLIDLISFLLGWNAYRKLVGDNDPHYDASLNLLRRYQPDLVAGYKAHFEPLVERPAFQRFRARLRIAVKPLRSADHAIEQAEFAAELLPYLRTQTSVMREIFTGRAGAPAMRIASVAAEESPEALLHVLATVPSASRLRLPKKWLREAAQLANVAPSDLEQTLADASSAKDLGAALRVIESRLDKLDPTSAEAVKLQEQKRTLLDEVDSLAADSPSPETVVASVASETAKPREYATETSRARKLNPDKEAAMMVRGKGIIAAGAGAGKTMTLASKVVYHINELGVPARSVIATSFSRKSAAELRRRIEKYGAEIDAKAATGFGTTHSVAARLMREYQQGGRDGLKSHEQTNLVRLAMEQVQMGEEGRYGSPPPPMSLLEGLGADEPAHPQSDATTPGAGLTFAEACQEAYERRARLRSGFLRSFIESFFNTQDRFYPVTMQKTKNLSDPRGLTSKQKDILQDVFRFAGVDYDVHNPTKSDPNLSGTARVAKKTPDKDKGMREKYEFFSRPAGQWFNMGLVLTEGEGDHERPIPLGTFKNAITKYKGRMVSPTEAWAQDPGPEAAVYAAYEWLKGPRGEPDFQGKGDFDDVLIDVSKMMLRSPKIRKQIQSRFKVVLVDEAQDLNRSQHMMFGLITGFIDPDKAPRVGTAKKIHELAHDDGHMAADTYVFIGDDKQAIYEFRSADPEVFIDMSDLVEGGAGFTTHVLETNYRSGKNIVEAANRLIAHNEKQIPMVCKANPDRTHEGGIKAIRFAPDGTGDAAVWLAEKIASDMQEGGDRAAEKLSYDHYGVGLRSNAEAYIYGLELLKRGIPFRSKANFFRDPNAKALIHWLTLADEGLHGDEQRINEAVLNARLVPVAMLGKKFLEKLTEKATGNYLLWLRDNWQQIYGSRGKWAGLVKSYTENLLKVAALAEQELTSEEVLHEIMQLQGFDGQSVRDGMLDTVRRDDEAMAELRAADPDGAIDESALEEAAFAPIAPLKGLLESRANLSESMKYVRTLERANEKLTAVDDPDAQRVNEPAVTLGTMHSWKGLEVPHMFVPIVGGKFPRTDGSAEALASERRLAYVALTRGEDNVTVLNIPSTRNTKNGPPVILESRFIDEMCIPSEVNLDKTASLKAAAEHVPLPPGVSPQDEALMDAYLRGEDPLSEEMLAAWGPTLYDGEV